MSISVSVISLHCSSSGVHHIETIRYGQEDALSHEAVMKINSNSVFT